VIGLVLLDLAIVVTELALSSFYPVHDNAPHAGEGSSTAGCAVAVLGATWPPRLLPASPRGASSRPTNPLARHICLAAHPPPAPSKRIPRCLQCTRLRMC
jgi:hypothetical protein